MKKELQFSYYMRIVVGIIIYVLFFYYVISGIIKADNIGTIIFNIIIGLVFGTVGLLYEYLRIFFDLATKRLTVECNPKKALETIKKVEKADIFKTYKSSCQMERILAYVDLRDFEKLKDVISDIEKSDTTDYDLLLTSRYGSMIAYGESGNRGKSNESFKRLTSLRDTKSSKGRRYKGAYYFNWEVVNGQHKNYEGDYQGAFHYLKEINETNMNHREVLQYLLAKSKAAKELKNNSVFDESLERIKKLAKNNDAILDYIDNM